MASDGDDPDASSLSTIRDLLVALPDGEYMYRHAEAPTRDLEYEELARVVEAARSLNFYDRVRRWSFAHEARSASRSFIAWSSTRTDSTSRRFMIRRRSSQGRTLS